MRDFDMNVRDIMDDVETALEATNPSFAFRSGYYYSLLVSLASKHPEVLEELISTRDYLESKT
jgi:hypothetical protein